MPSSNPPNNQHTSIEDIQSYLRHVFMSVDGCSIYFDDGSGNQLSFQTRSNSTLIVFRRKNQNYGPIYDLFKGAPSGSMTVSLAVKIICENLLWKTAQFPNCKLKMLIETRKYPRKLFISHCGFPYVLFRKRRSLKNPPSQ